MELNGKLYYEWAASVECMFFFLMIPPPPRSTQSRSSAASDVYKRQVLARAPHYLARVTSGAPSCLPLLFLISARFSNPLNLCRWHGSGSAPALASRSWRKRAGPRSPSISSTAAAAPNRSTARRSCTERLIVCILQASAGNRAGGRTVTDETVRIKPNPREDDGAVSGEVAECDLGGGPLRGTRHGWQVKTVRSRF